MLFDFEQPDELLTPLIHHAGVNDVNPILTSNDLSSADDRDICFSSIPLKKTEYVVTSKDHSNENNEHYLQQQDDLFSSFDFPVLSELSRTELQLDGISIDRYISQGALPSPPMDMQNLSDMTDLTFYPVDDDSTDSTSLWVGEECTVESKCPEGVLVPPSPPLSSVDSFSPSVSRNESSKKRNFSMVERKLRKKDQNKTAAEKYRLKKRSERSELLTRHSDLKNQNRELKFEMESLTFQLEHFKQLFLDVLQIPIPSTVSK